MFVSNKQDTCEHVRDYGPRGSVDVNVWCGVVACDYECCDACYEGHVLSVHFFNAPSMFRIDNQYQDAIQRGYWAERICYGTEGKTEAAYYRE